MCFILGIKEISVLKLETEMHILNQQVEEENR